MKKGIIWAILFCFVLGLASTAMASVEDFKANGGKQFKEYMLDAVKKGIPDKNLAKKLTVKDLEFDKVVESQMGDISIYGVLLTVKPIGQTQPFIVDKSGRYIIAQAYDVKTKEDAMNPINKEFAPFFAKKAAKRMKAEIKKAKANKMKADIGSVIVKGEGDHVLSLVSDPFCPYCRKAWNLVRQSQMAKIKELRLMHFPLDMHPGAKLASMAMLWAEKNMHADVAKVVDFAYSELQPTRDPKKANEFVAEQFMNKFAKFKALGATPADVVAALSTAVGADMNAEIAAAKKMGITGTPAIYVDRIPVAGGANFNFMNALLDENVAK